jgi:predicted  nucleic acid-binding Zn-ribbon protein
MSESQIVTYSLEDILIRIEKKIEKQSEDFQSLKGDFQSLKDDFQSLKDDFQSLKAEFKEDIAQLSQKITVVDATLKSQQLLIQKIPDLAEKVGELKNWKQVSLIFITAFVSSILTGTIGGVIGWLIRGSNP